MTTFEKVEALLKNATAHDYTFDKTFNPMDCDVLILNLYFNNSFIYYLCNWIEKSRIDVDSIGSIRVNIISEHYNFDGTPILVLDLWVGEHQLHYNYIYK